MCLPGVRVCVCVSFFRFRLWFYVIPQPTIFSWHWCVPCLSASIDVQQYVGCLSDASVFFISSHLFLSRTWLSAVSAFVSSAVSEVLISGQCFFSGRQQSVMCLPAVSSVLCSSKGCLMISTLSVHQQYIVTRMFGVVTDVFCFISSGQLFVFVLCVAVVLFYQQSVRLLPAVSGYQL